MRLSPVEEVRTTLGFGDMTDINDAIVQSLQATAIQISGLIGTDLDQVTREDHFLVERPIKSQFPAFVTKFRMRMGFLASTPQVTMINQEGASTDISDSFVFDLEKGTALNTVTDFYRVQVKFAYTAGFEEDTTDPGLYDPTQVPDWLKEASRVGALMMLATNPSVNQAVELDADLYKKQFYTIIDARRRYAPAALLPE